MGVRANELRIGNWVRWNYEESSEGNVYPVEYGYELDDIKNNPNIVKPIPLSEEWLIKFGFIRQGGRQMWVKDKLCIELKELPNIRGEFIEGWYIGLKDLGNVLFHSFMKVTHAHQLQNLYFALTGEELTIKKTDETNQKVNQ